MGKEKRKPNRTDSQPRTRCSLQPIRQTWIEVAEKTRAGKGFLLPNRDIDRFVLSHFRLNPESTEVILDIGGGRGPTTSQIKGNRKILALDIANSGEEKHSFPRQLVLGNAEKAPIKSDSADTVLAINTLQWIDIEKGAEEIKRALKPGGRAIIVLDHGKGFLIERSIATLEIGFVALEITKKILDGEIANMQQLEEEVMRRFKDPKLRRTYASDLIQKLNAIQNHGQVGLTNVTRQYNTLKSQLELTSHAAENKLFDSPEKVKSFFKKHGFTNVEVTEIKQSEGEYINAQFYLPKGAIVAFGITIKKAA